MSRLIEMRRNPVFKKGLHDLVEKNFAGRTGLVALEIGSYQGESAELFLSTGRFSRIYCIDAWANGYDDADKASFSANIAEKAFDQRFEDEKRVVKIKGHSWDVVGRIQDGAIDFLYVDGNHRGDAVARDLELYAPKVKIGGVLAGHDYGPEPKYRGLIDAVNEFLHGKPEYVFCDYSWSNRKN